MHAVRFELTQFALLEAASNLESSPLDLSGTRAPDSGKIAEMTLSSCK